MLSEAAGRRQAAAEEFRLQVAAGEWDGAWEAVPKGYAQANVLILPREFAFEFLVFCQRNPKACGLLEVLDPGDPVPRHSAPTADVRNQLHRYRIWRDGELVDTVEDISAVWRDDLVTFLLGCSFTFAAALQWAGVEFQTGGVYQSAIECAPAGRFAAAQAVSMRSMTPAAAIRATQITSRFPAAHGAPVHIGDPSVIGIEDLSNPEYTLGGFVPMPSGHVPVFWGCSVTAETAARLARPDLMVSLEPPFMFVTDLLVDELAVF